MEAIRSSWSRDTSATPELWSEENPARGQCDASSFVAWEYLGGDLVLGKVFVDGEQTEHHYWNRIGGVDVDLTSDQFRAGESIRDATLVPSDHLHSNQASMREELARRIGLMRAAVADKLSTTE